MVPVAEKQATKILGEVSSVGLLSSTGFDVILPPLSELVLELDWLLLLPPLLVFWLLLLLFPFVLALDPDELLLPPLLVF